MLLLDDDVNCVEIDNSKLAETNKISELFPIKPVICKFFKPKLKGSNHAYTPEPNKDSIIRHEEKFLTRKHAKSQSRSLQNFIKGEGFMKTENPYQYFSSTDSSSFSNLPSISLECSKTSESFSDSDNQDPDESGVTSLIVKNVYSLCKTHQSKNSEINLTNVLNECSRSCNNKVIATKKSTRKRSNFSKRKSKTKFIEKPSLRINKEKENPDLNVSDSELSDALTERMTLDVRDFDLPVCRNTLNFDLQTNENIQNLDLMQPVVLLDRYEPERIAPHLFPDHEMLRLTINLKSKSLVDRPINKNSSFFPNVDGPTNKISKSFLSAASNTNHDSIENDNLYCLVCNQSNETTCSNHPVKWIPNERIDCPHVEYVVDKSFDKYLNKSREKSYCNCNGNELEHIQNDLPHMFQLKESDNSEIGVWTKQLLKQGTVIGPYLGKIMGNSEISKPYFTRGCSQSGLTEGLHCLRFAFKSNWLRCVRFTNNPDKANLEILKYDGKIFFRAFQDISSHLELLLFNESPQRVANTKIDAPSLIFHSPGITNVSLEDWANQKAIIMKIRKLYLENARLTVVNIIDQLRCEHPDLNGLSENALSEIITKLRPVSTERPKIDDKMTEYITKLLRDNPSITSTEIIRSIGERFPSIPRFNKAFINRFIRVHKLRPLLGADEKADMETVQSIVGMVTEDSKTSVKDVQQMLLIKYPTKPQLDCQTIDKIIKLNFCRLYYKKSKHQVDQEVVKGIRKLVNRYDGAISRQKILDKIKERMPEKKNVSIEYIRYLMRTFKIKLKPPQL